jgi:ectonucleotide pyrophosphatase/phosphodiesterase family member 5
MSNSEALNPLWWKGEPIWVTAEKQKTTSATIFWPGSEVEIKNTRPSHWLKFNGSMDYEERINYFFKFLEDKEKPAKLFTLYFEEVDHSGHLYGPYNK